MARTCAMQCARHPTTTTDHSGGSIGRDLGGGDGRWPTQLPASRLFMEGFGSVPGNLLAQAVQQHREASGRFELPVPGRAERPSGAGSGQVVCPAPFARPLVQVAPFGAFSSAPPTRASHWCRFPGLQWAPLHTQIQRYGPGAGTQAQLTKTAPRYYAHPDATPSIYKCSKMIEDQATWQILAK